jgi:hypothetical protein
MINNPARRDNQEINLLTGKNVSPKVSFLRIRTASGETSGSWPGPGLADFSPPPFGLDLAKENTVSLL